MSDYENLHYLVANIFNIGIGYSEEQLISELKEEASNIEFDLIRQHWTRR